MDDPAASGKRTHHPGELARPHRRLTNAAARALLLLAPFLGPACNQRAVESWLSSGEATAAPAPSLYTEAALSKALGELKKRIPSPAQALSLLVYPDRLVLQIQDPASPGNALQYVCRGNAVTAPESVKLLGTGKLDENVFPLDTARLDAIPRLVKEAHAKANIPEGAVARVLLRRNLPDTADVQFRVFVTSQRRDATVDADQNGVILE